MCGYTYTRDAIGGGNPSSIAILSNLLLANTKSELPNMVPESRSECLQEKIISKQETKTNCLTDDMTQNCLLESKDP